MSLCEYKTLKHTHQTHSHHFSLYMLVMNILFQHQTPQHKAQRLSYLSPCGAVPRQTGTFPVKPAVLPQKIYLKFISVLSRHV